MAPLTFTEALQADVATLQAAHLILAGALDKAFALVANGHVFPGGWPLSPRAQPEPAGAVASGQRHLRLSSHQVPRRALCPPPGAAPVSARPSASRPIRTMSAGNPSPIRSRCRPRPCPRRPRVSMCACRLPGARCSGRCATMTRRGSRHAWRRSWRATPWSRPRRRPPARQRGSSARSSTTRRPCTARSPTFARCIMWR